MQRSDRRSAGIPTSHTPPTRQGGPSPRPLTSVPESAPLSADALHSHYRTPQVANTPQSAQGYPTHQEALIASGGSAHGAYSRDHAVPAMMPEYQQQDVAHWQNFGQNPSMTLNTMTAWDESLRSPQNSPSTVPSPDAMLALGSFHQGSGQGYYGGWEHSSYVGSSPVSGGSVGDSPVRYMDVPQNNTMRIPASSGYATAALPEPQMVWLDRQEAGPDLSGLRATPESLSLSVAPSQHPSPMTRRRSSPKMPYPSGSAYPAAVGPHRRIALPKGKHDKSESTTDGDNDMMEEDRESESDVGAQRHRKKQYAKGFRDRERQLFQEMRQRLFPQDPHTKRSECMEKAIEGLDELEALRVQARQREEEIEALKQKLQAAEMKAEMLVHDLREKEALLANQGYGGYMG